MADTLHHFILVFTKIEDYQFRGHPQGPRKFSTYAYTDEQAVQDLFDTIPEVDSGEIYQRLNAPTGARRLNYERY